MKDKKIKQTENSHLKIKVKKGEFIDQYNRKVVEVKWEDADGEVSLGSMSNPSNVLEFKYNIPDDKPLFRRLLGED